MYAGAQPIFLAFLAVVLAGLLQLVGPLILGYRLGKTHLVVNVLRVIPIYWISYANVRDVYEVDFLRALSLFQLKIRSRIFGRTIRIEKRAFWIFRSIDITPTAPDDFLTSAREKITNSQNVVAN